jgi:hypothetical protein
VISSASTSPRDLNPAPNLLLLLRRQEFSPADVFQVHPHQIELFPCESGFWSFLDLLGFQRFAVGLFERLLVKRLGLLFFEEPLGRLDNRRTHFTVAVNRNEAELVGALAPIQHPSIAFGLTPIDEGFSGSPRRRYVRGSLGHQRSGCCWIVLQEHCPRQRTVNPWRNA